MIERKWKSLSGEKIDLRSAVLAEIMGSDVPIEVHIGTDSQQAGKDTEYVTVVVVTRLRRGGRVFFTQERVPRIRSLHERLYREVWQTAELAMELTSTPDVGVADALSGLEPTLHIDANVDPQYKSAAYAQELAGLCVGMGFKHVLLKPDSWAAAHAADHAVKHKHENRKPHAEPKRRAS